MCQRFILPVNSLSDHLRDSGFDWIVMYDVADFASSTAKPVTVLKKKVEYFQLLPSVVSVSSFYGN